ncbi:MAG: hypothetical protein EOO65_04325 [Methanosarcinales archaeon]|nr:MAG: hypothetical protein EOO65_04325 [Methanosarcinales archaeon]
MGLLSNSMDKRDRPAAELVEAGHEGECVQIRARAAQRTSKPSGVETAIDQVESFIRDPTNLLRVTALAHMNKQVNAVLASTSCNFPPLDLYA